MGFLKSKRKVSLVLGGGGARGLAHIGVIKALNQHGYRIEEIVGCSIGSLVGAAYAQGNLDGLEDWMLKITKRKVFRLMDFNNPRFGLLKGERIFDALKDILKETNIEDMDIPFRVLATDMLHEQEVVFSTGSLHQAIRASIAIPGVFTSVENEQWNLVDGGVLNPLPINHVKKGRRNLVVAVNLDGRPDAKFGQLKEAKNLDSLSLLQESYYMMRRKIAEMSISLYKPDYVIHVPHNIAGLWDYNEAEMLIEKGAELTRLIMPALSARRGRKPTQDASSTRLNAPAESVD